MEQVLQFLRDCRTFFLATTEGDQPRVRPFGAVCIFDGKLYITTNNKKKVFAQIQKWIVEYKTTDDKKKRKQLAINMKKTEQSALSLVERLSCFSGTLSKLSIIRNHVNVHVAWQIISCCIRYT